VSRQAYSHVENAATAVLHILFTLRHIRLRLRNDWRIQRPVDLLLNKLFPA